MKKKLGLYILSYKRFDYLVEMIESLLAQTNPNFDIIVSENSPDGEILNKLKINYPNHLQISYLKFNLSAIDHINQVRLLGTQHYEYFGILHDDDRVDTQFVDDILSHINQNHDFTTLSYNSLIIDTDILTQNKMNSALCSEKKITTTDEFISGYINKYIGITAFPSYIYNSKYTANIALKANEAGKHSDVTFLIKLIEQNHAPFIVSEKCLYYYRRHAKNDSNSIHLKDTYKLCQFMFIHSKKYITKFNISIFLIKNGIKAFLQFLKRK